MNHCTCRRGPTLAEKCATAARLEARKQTREIRVQADGWRERFDAAAKREDAYVDLCVRAAAGELTHPFRA